MDTNEQKYNHGRNSTTNKETNLKSSKNVQTISSDSDVFYDLPEENDSSIPKSSNRSRTTQNDRYRDHTNLSHKPNIEAPAGPRQQPAGHRQTYQAKDKNDENDNGNNIHKERSSLSNYFTPRGSCLCSNVSQDGFSNLSSDEGSSMVKLSFSTTACADLQGSYECFCAEEEEAGSCHKFWCQRYEVLGNKKKTMRAFESRKELIDRKEDIETKIASCSEKPIFDDVEMIPTYECHCVSKRLIVSSFTGSCQKEEIESPKVKSFSRTGPNPSEGEENTGPSPKVLNLLEKKSRPELFAQPESRILRNCNDSSKYQNSENLISNSTEDLCSCEDFENSTKGSTELPPERLYVKETKHSTGPHWNESFCSVGTGITPRQTIDENVVPLLQGIFDVLQTMRDERLHLGPIASKNIDIHLDEPFNGLSTPPPASSSLPKFSKQLLGIPPDSQSYMPSSNNLKFEEETDRDFINSEDNLAILELPERDVEDFGRNYQQTSSTSQRLIPVDMDLLRTDEELIWEPNSNFDKPEVEGEVGQEREFIRLQSSEKLKFCEGRNCPTEGSQNLYNTEKAESTSRLSSLKRSSSMDVNSDECICGELENCAENCYKNPSNKTTKTPDSKIASLQELRIDLSHENGQTFQKIEVSQAVQVNLMSLENLTSRSEEFSTLNNQLEDLSDEKLLKISEMDRSKDTLQLKVNSKKEITKFDVGTDCPDFKNDVDTYCPYLGNDDRSSTKSCHFSQEPTNPQNQEMSQFIESILFDLKAMNSFRKNNSHWQSFARLPCASTGAWQRPSKDLSYPVTIETVQELGTNSLFVKWRVQNFGNIGGYEIFLDGHLTNRYFNCIHQAAVICDVDLHYPHRITLRARPLLPLMTSLPATDSCSSSTSNTKYPSNTSTHPEASCPQPDGSVWYPSVYHFEPNSLSAPINAVLY